MELKFLIPALAGLLLLPALAMGQDRYSWTGPYVGADIGINRTRVDQFGAENALTLGLNGGYNYQLSQLLVVGGDIFYEYNRQKDHDFQSGRAAHFGSNVYGVAGLVGFPVGMVGAFMPYIKLGYGHLQGTGDASGSDNAWRVGAGLAWRLGLPVSVSIEYMHAEYGGGSGNWKNENLTLGVSYHFGS